MSTGVHRSTSDDSRASVLILEDDPALARSLSRHVSGLGYTCRVASSSEEARSALREAPVAFLIADLELPDGSGVDLIRWGLGAGLVHAATAMTADPRCERVVSAMRAGAQTVLGKPFDLAELTELLHAHELTRVSTSEWRTRFAPELIGRSWVLEEQVGIASRVANTEFGVLITGETGTGKEVLAKALHEGSSRARGPFVAVNCAALPEELIEAELFGHVAGAFTGADRHRVGRVLSAQGGTLFLDEIGDMPLSAQAKLLRVLQERKVCPVGSDAEHSVDIRVIAATHHSLEERCELGSFRVDLLYRLNVITLELPPLRERGDDVVLLARHFLRRFAEQNGSPPLSLDAGAEAALCAYAWPGNIRELKNGIERSALLASSTTLGAADLRIGPRTRMDSGRRLVAASAPAVEPPCSPTPTPALVPLEPVSTADLDLRTALQRREQELIQIALRKAGGNRTEAAALLGLNRTTLVEKLRRSAG